QTNTRNLTEGRVRLLMRRRVHASAHAAFLWAVPEGRRVRFRHLSLPALSHELVNRRHLAVVSFLNIRKTRAAICRQWAIGVRKAHYRGQMRHVKRLRPSCIN